MGGVADAPPPPPPAAPKKGRATAPTSERKVTRTLYPQQSQAAGGQAAPGAGLGSGEGGAGDYPHWAHQNTGTPATAAPPHERRGAGESVDAPKRGPGPG